MSAYIFNIKQNDRKPNLEAQLFDAQGDPVNLTDAVSVTFTMKSAVGSTIKIDNGACQTSNDATGVKSIVSYPWAAGDTDTVGNYKGEFKVTWATGIKQTFPDNDYVKVIVGNDIP